MISPAWRSAATRPTSCSADPPQPTNASHEANRLAPLPIDGSPVWAVARRAVIGPSPHQAAENRTAPAPDRGGVAFDDPRNDPVSLAWAEAQLANRPFDEVYARLVRAAGARRRIGRQPGSAAAAVERGEAGRPRPWSPAIRPLRPRTRAPWIEGVAILAGGGHRALATSFLRFLATSGRADPPSRVPKNGSHDDLGLLADLLGATLVDAQDELWSAWSVLERMALPPTSSGG